MGNVGTIKATINSAASLKQLGHDVKIYKIFHEWEGYESLIKKYNLEIVDFGLSRFFKQLPGKGIGFRFSMLIYSLYCYGRLKKNWQEEQPDIVIASLLGSLPLAVRKHAKYQPKIINSIQGRPRLNAVRRALWKRQYAASDLLITLSDETRQELLDKIGLQPEKVVRLDNPVIDAEIDRLKEEPLPPEDSGFRYILGVGRLTRQKDFSTLIRAFSLLPQKEELKLIILGEGEERGKLESLIAELHLQGKVLLKGFVQNPYRYMHHAEAFVLSSLWEDAGHVMLEAAYVKAPIVSTRCPSGQEEFLDFGEGGELCEVGSPENMADCIQKVLDRDTDTKIQHAYQKSLGFTMEKHGEKLQELMGRL
jgi:glycosyltransferase involved in cell wall biosynthesis